MAELFAAIKGGDAASVERMLREDAKLVDTRDENGLSPILAALYHGQNEITTTILRRRPSLNIFEAAAVGDAARVREIVSRDPTEANRTSTDGYTPLGL